MWRFQWNDDFWVTLTDLFISRAGRLFHSYLLGCDVFQLWYLHLRYEFSCSLKYWVSHTFNERHTDLVLSKVYVESSHVLSSILDCCWIVPDSFGSDSSSLFGVNFNECLYKVMPFWGRQAGVVSCCFQKYTCLSWTAQQTDVWEPSSYY